MKKGHIIILVIMMMFIIATTSCGSQASRVNENLSQEADNFNVLREVTVINCITNEVLFQMKGRLSINADVDDNQLEVIVEHEKDLFRKHLIGLSDNVTYVIEDKGGAKVDKYGYELNFNPKFLKMIDPKLID